MTSGEPKKLQRRLAAIMAADVVGFSNLMGEDEAGTVVRVKRLQSEVIEPHVAEHGGRIVKTMGDGFLVEFPSASGAIECAVAIQEALSGGGAHVNSQAIQLRIGINLGDIIIETDGDVFGDGVNIAARLEQIADPGSVFISGKVHEEVRGKLPYTFEDKGEQQVKNVERPLRVYALSGRHGMGITAEASARTLLLPDRPSIAVLPFTNMSGDPEQEYFADGVVEDIITALSRVRLFFVIARNSSFTYKGKAVDIRRVGRELGVRYVLEGSIRKAGSRVRVTGQLIESETAGHLWADRYEGAIEDVFDLQDQITASVVGVIAPRLELAEIERSQRKPTESLNAYDHFLRGMALQYQGTRESVSAALRHFETAISLDSNFASAYAMATRCYALRKAQFWTENPKEDVAQTIRLAQKAVSLGKDDAVTLYASGYALAFVAGDLAAGGALLEEALALNPNLAIAWSNSGFVKLWSGEVETAIECIMRAVRLSPLDPMLHVMESAIAHAHYQADRFEQAASWAEKALRRQPTWTPAARVAAASYAQARLSGQVEQAMARLRAMQPELRVSNLRDVTGPYRP